MREEAWKYTCEDCGYYVFVTKQNTTSKEFQKVLRGWTEHFHMTDGYTPPGDKRHLCPLCSIDFKKS